MDRDNIIICRGPARGVGKVAGEGNTTLNLEIIFQNSDYRPNYCWKREKLLLTIISRVPCQSGAAVVDITYVLESRSALPKYDKELPSYKLDVRLS